MTSGGTLIYQKAKKASRKNINKSVAKYTKTARMILSSILPPVLLVFWWFYKKQNKTRLNGFVLALKFKLSCKRSQILVDNFAYMKLWQILKFHERVISALILVVSFARPKISSQLLRVSGILKIYNTI